MLLSCTTFWLLRVLSCLGMFQSAIHNKWHMYRGWFASVETAREKESSSSTPTELLILIYVLVSTRAAMPEARATDMLGKQQGAPGWKSKDPPHTRSCPKRLLCGEPDITAGRLRNALAAKCTRMGQHSDTQYVCRSSRALDIEPWCAQTTCRAK